MSDVLDLARWLEESTQVDGANSPDCQHTHSMLVRTHHAYTKSFKRITRL
jgi:hypothetical protein